MSAPRVSIVVLNWNGADDTLACLDSLATLTYPNFDVVVVDNGSNDNSVENLRAYTSAYPLTLLETNRNLGYAGGNNFGVRHTLEKGAEYVLILNNDTTVAPDLLEQLVDAALSTPSAGVFSARVMYFDEPEKVWFDGARWNNGTLKLEWPGQGRNENELDKANHDTDYASGAALFFRKEVAQKIGLLDEKFFLVWEEVDWCFRARKAGWRNIVVPSAKVWHKIGVSFGSEQSPLRIYFSIRNQLLWFSRHTTVKAQLQLGLRNLRKLVPIFYISRGIDAKFARRLAWAFHDYLNAWMGRGNRYEYLSVRRAVLDFLLGRFGDCPHEVRVWSQQWAANQHN